MSHIISVTSRKPALNAYSGQLRSAGVPVNNVTTLEFVRFKLTGRKYRILLAHDLTGHSEIALVRAIRLTLEREGHLTIFHVVNSGSASNVCEAKRANAKHHLENEVRRWAGRSQLSYNIDVGIGDAPDAIAARARAHNIDLIVTGRHRRSRLADAFAPSVIGRLLQLSERPVLVVSNSNQCAYQRILMPIDLSKASAARLQFAATFLPRARFHLLLAHERRLPNCLSPVSLLLKQAEKTTQSSKLSEQQLNGALSRLLEGVELDHRPIITCTNRELLALVKEELARQKTDLVVLGIHARSDGLLAARAVETTALRASSCDILFPSRYGPSPG